MDLQNILSALSTIGMLILGAFSIYLKTSAKAQTKAKEISDKISEIIAQAVVLIAKAEEEYKDWTGGEKFNAVVTELYELVPEVLRGIITRDMIEDIVQSTFDEIKKYATAKMDEAVEKIDVSDNTEQATEEE